MIETHGSKLAFLLEAIGCVNPKIVELVVIFVVPPVPLNFKPFAMSRAHPKVESVIKREY